MQNFPKISCVMVTTGRVECIKRSVQCYLAQTYKNKELVILSQGRDAENAAIASFLVELCRPDIQFVVAPRDLTLGAMRNLSIEVATGLIICQWDDDDLYHPHRLVTQYRALLGEHVVASAYSQHLKYFADSHRLYWIDWAAEGGWRAYLPGSVMFRKSLFHQAKNTLYPDSGEQSGREEDVNVLTKLNKWGHIVALTEAFHYIYVFHGNNVYDLAHHELVLKKRVFGRDDLLRRRDDMERTFQLVGLDTVSVCSLDEIVFEHRGLAND